MQPATVICPLCGDKVDKLLYRFHIDSEKAVIEKIRQENPAWTEHDGICGRCIDYYHTQIVLEQRMLPGIGPYFPVKSPDDFIILPTPLRLDVDPRFTGKGVTICFIDSGFYPHPDLVATRNRIKKFIDINHPERNTMKPHAQNWHGTMTSVVCAGDGYLSNGLYKGIASEAELVLIKVQDEQGKITTSNIVKALEWVLQNHAAFNIKIVNMSVADDLPLSYKESKVDQLVEQLFAEGIVVVAAAGNDENGTIKPPANALHTIAVGGMSDQNNLDEDEIALYHSSYGYTADGLMKPELIANAIWIAAPILPDTIEKTEAEVLHRLLSLDDVQLQKSFQQNANAIKAKTNIDLAISEDTDVSTIGPVLIQRIQATKYFSPHYMHVDGTSFAAPIVTAVIAQLLEINPSLAPLQIRSILFSTAKPFKSLPIERQGFGYIQPRRAVVKALRKSKIMSIHASPFINRGKRTIQFFIQHDCASQIALAGSFNHWSSDVLLLEPGNNGIWSIEIPMLPAGKYAYKFFVDDRVWIEDVFNPYREPDGLNGWNSILQISQ